MAELYGIDLTKLPPRPNKRKGGLKADAAMADLTTRLGEFFPSDVGRGRVRHGVDEMTEWCDRLSDWPISDGKPLDGILVYLHRKGVYQAFWIGWSIWHFAYQNRMKKRTKQGDDVRLSIRGMSAEVAGSLAFDLSLNTRPGDTRTCDLGRSTEIRSCQRLFGALQIYPRDLEKHPTSPFVLAWPLDPGRDGYVWFFVGWMTPEEAFAHPEWSGQIGGDVQQLVPWRELHPLPPPEVSDG